MFTLTMTDEHARHGRRGAGRHAHRLRRRRTTPSVRDALERLVEASGWRAETFASAQAFLDRPRARVPSCLVLDVALPGLNGLDVQRRLAVERPDTSVVYHRVRRHSPWPSRR